MVVIIVPDIGFLLLVDLDKKNVFCRFLLLNSVYSFHLFSSFAINYIETLEKISGIHTMSKGFPKGLILVKYYGQNYWQYIPNSIL